MKNWAGNYEYGAARIHRPTTVEQVQEIVRHARKVRALGTRHSFNDIADTPEDLISLEHFDKVVSLDREKRQITIEGGLAYGRFCNELNAAGFALPNLASLPHISVAGACATATHGSGEKVGCLSTSVASLEIVRGDGEIVQASREGATVNLGALGIVTKLTLDVSPTFEINQVVYERLPLASLEQNFDAIEASGYSVSFFTDWSGDAINQVWVKRKEPAPDDQDFFGAKRADGHRHPIGELSPVNCTPQMAIPGPWHERLPHFRMDFTPSSGEELQSEYFVPRKFALDAIHAVDSLRGRISPLLHITEIRAIAADDLWMSPFYRQDSIAIHFTWKQEWEAVRALLPVIEERLAPFGARPHWGKLFTMIPGPLYERLPDFLALRQEFDPEGKFSNGFFQRYLG